MEFDSCFPPPPHYVTQRHLFSAFPHHSLMRVQSCQTASILSKTHPESENKKDLQILCHAIGSS